MPRRRTHPAPLVAALALLALLAQAEQPWKDKSAGAWTEEEAVQVLTDSPWGRAVDVLQMSGRTLARLPDGRAVVYKEAPNAPPRFLFTGRARIEPEYVVATYGVRWSSAGIVQAALARLKELSPTLADVQAPPPELPADHYVVTVRVIRPPSQTSADAMNLVTYVDRNGKLRRDEPPLVNDLFAGLNPEQLKALAELRTSKKLHVKPDRAVRHGLGISEGICFFFPRRQDGQETLAAGTEWAEFVFAGRAELKAKFKLKEMQVGGRPDY